ncbi:MAG TPA: hypothetical protein VMU51_01560 [Mycobacteriales bacterium]|nr:hypothetical protein [Mycobacteriales bacterium]
MTMVECPACHLRFHTQTEVEWHARNEHRRHRHHDVVEVGDGPAELPQPPPIADDPDLREAGSPPVAADT